MVDCGLIRAFADRHGEIKRNFKKPVENESAGRLPLHGYWIIRKHGSSRAFARCLGMKTVTLLD